MSNREEQMTTFDLTPNQIKWKAHYDKLCQRGQDRASTRKEACSILEEVERHHIIPECWFKDRKRKGPIGWLEGDPDAPENIVFLSWHSLND